MESELRINAKVWFYASLLWAGFMIGAVCTNFAYIMANRRAVEAMRHACCQHCDSVWPCVTCECP